MRHVKKILAFALTFVMAFAMCGTAWAADGDRTVDAKVSVTGFESGDTVTAYQFITWVDGDGWKLADGITGITIDDITDAEDLTVKELATLAKQTDKMTAVTGTTSADGKSWEKTCGTTGTAGSYLILVKSGTAKYIYNPVVVSADFDGTVDAVDLTAETATIKKQEIKIEKEADSADDYDVQVGDIVHFTVKVTVPQYNDNWTDPYFAVTDALSNGLTIEDIPTIDGLTVFTDEETSYDYKIISGGTKGASGFTIQFSENYLKNNASAVLEIKYSAKVGEAVKDAKQVHEETNTATLEFSNNPSNSEDHKTVDDETHHYTFAIDATRLGQDSEKTNELIKVGVDDADTTITEIIEGQVTQTGVSPLVGAEFKLTGKGPNNSGTFELTATSGEDGRIFFNNLEAGTYTLQETKAPAGYIKDSTSHTVVIAAEYNDDTTLKSYTVTIDGETTSTYTATTDAENPITYTNNPSFAIPNTKGAELPSTGGIGTTIFYVVGGVMVAGAAILLLTKRRANAAE